MQEFIEALTKSEVASDDIRTPSKTHSIFKHLAEGVDGITISESLSTIEVFQRGVDYVVSCDDAQPVMSHLMLDDSQVEIFGKEYKVRRRGNAVVIYSDIDLGISNDQSLASRLNTFLVSITSGGGISFLGSPSLSLTVRLVDLIAKALPESSCNVFFDGKKYVMSEYDVETNQVLNSTSRASLSELMLCVDLSPYKYVFVESFSGFEDVQGAVNLAASGKRVIYVKNSVSSVYALYSSMLVIDTHVLSPLFSGAFFVNSLAYVKGATVPKVQFQQHNSFNKWGSLKTSPLRDELILTDPQRGLLEVAKHELIISEGITPSKAVSKWISEKVNPLDFASNLRLDQGWISIADEAAIAVRDESVTFDQVLGKISLI
ncbi:hypothetical protein OTK49_26680 [Vibrio coralliirubri]|uniref:hypothetical protein n=1 Tax=Vibrio coralliirubri TaxID=1516159 RepID=UPI00228473A3|nr:hypothetical protein [Vibrio coralliirubri]MCY9866127.1 hypothetical protein [Vibrio coralliirubri]